MKQKKTYIKPEILVEEWKFWKETNHSVSRKRIYEVSNFGRGRINNELVDFSKQKSVYYTFGGKHLHKIVAELFIPNPENKSCVDHIDTNIHNNMSWNLRWVTPKENMNNPLTLKHLSKGLKTSDLRKSIMQSSEYKKKQSEVQKIIQNTPEVKQKHRDARKDRIWINNGNEQKWINKNSLNSYLNNGWMLGRGKNKKQK